MTSTIAFELGSVPERGSAVICIPVLAIDERTLATIRNVIEHSELVAPILLAGPATPIEQLAEGLLTERHERSLTLVVQDGGEASAVNQAMRVSQPADMALVVPGCLVTSEWLARLQGAATSDSIVASATALSIGGGGVELFDVESDDAAGLLIHADLSYAASAVESTQSGDAAEQAAREVRRNALRLCPRIATMGPGCVYIRRTTWELAGALDGDLALDGALDEMARRATALGLIHVAADDVLVFSPSDQEGSATEAQSEPSSTEQREEAASVEDQAAQSAVEDSPRGGVQVRETMIGDESLPLRRSLNRARTALRRLSVTIDGRSLTAAVGGTQTYVIELILALAREREATVRVLIAPDISVRARDALATVPEIELLTYDEAIGNPVLTDVVHRPQQIFTPDDLALLRLVGRRVVVGQQDLIAYHNDTYHTSVDAWRGYRRTTRLALAGADQVIFFSDHARRDALAEDLLAERRAHVVGIGADTFKPTAPIGDPPDGHVLGEPFLLCLGADYAHKNRPFAIDLVGALKELGWEGRLVLSGARVAYGSSRDREAEILARNPELAHFVTDLGPVDEGSKQWLYAHACALLYPTLYEGFGLIPLEAARAGLPCLFAAQASLSEVAPDAATLIPWDARASAQAVLPLLSHGPARDEHLAKLRSHSVPGWGEIARALHVVYEQALTAPPSEAAPRVWQELDREDYIVRLDEDIAKHKLTAQEYQDAYHSLNTRVADGLPLIDEGGLLSKAQQRGLMRIAGRRGLGPMLLAPLGLVGRFGAGGTGR
jgi:glycosyltransferase involved in cell wall biosynthesis